MQESVYNKNNNKKKMSVSEYKKKVKFVTGAADGIVKVWSGMQRTGKEKVDPPLEKDIQFVVSKWSVTALCFMSHSKRLAVATSDRMISFYGLDGSTRKNSEPPKSRIEDLPAVPLCMEYVKYNHIGIDAKKSPEEEKPLESLLWGDDLGIITKYDFFKKDWHVCQYKNYVKKDRDYLVCHQDDHKKLYDEIQWEHEALKETRAMRE